MGDNCALHQTCFKASVRCWCLFSCFLVLFIFFARSFSPSELRFHLIFILRQKWLISQKCLTPDTTKSIYVFSISRYSPAFHHIFPSTQNTSQAQSELEKFVGHEWMNGVPTADIFIRFIFSFFRFCCLVVISHVCSMQFRAQPSHQIQIQIIIHQMAPNKSQQHNNICSTKINKIPFRSNAPPTRCFTRHSPLYCCVGVANTKKIHGP